MIQIGPIACVTLASSDLEATTNAYCSLLGFTRSGEGNFTGGDRLLRLAPELIGAPWITIDAPTDGLGSLRVIGGDFNAPQTFRTLGWAALEILVANVDELVTDLAGSSFQLAMAPATVGSTSLLRAAQFIGPAGEGLYLTEIHGDPPGFSLPRSTDKTAGVFIVVLACQNLEKSRGYLEKNFAVSRATDHKLPVRVLNKYFDLEPGTLHRISTLQVSEKCAIETDQYPSKALTRKINPGNLSGGISLVTIFGDVGEPEFHILPGGALLEVIPR